ncbi:hypothetical protein Hanom_Chr10g00900701 [Helianthus anomalus]
MAACDSYHRQQLGAAVMGFSDGEISKVARCGGGGWVLGGDELTAATGKKGMVVWVE